MPRRIVSLLSLSLAFGALPGAVSSAERADRFRDETTVLVVEVPVQVLRDGAPVRGLVAEDFEVRAMGRPQELVGFEVIDLTVVEPGASAGAGGVPGVAARRHFLLLFDLSFSDTGSVERARQAARRLIGNGLHPTDLVSVATYRASRGVELLLGFTTDRRQLELALESLAPAQTLRRSRDPLALVLGDSIELGSGIGTGSRDHDQQFSAELTEMYRDIQQFQSQDERDRRESEILAMSSAMGELASLMASVPGRKQVVFLSEGFDSEMLTGSRDFRRLAEMATDASVGEFWRVDNEERFGSTAVQTGVFRMLEEFKRADCAIQAVDISGLEAGADVAPQVYGEDGLFLFARETGGEFYRNDNDLERAVGELMERTSVTYLLAIQPQELALDGRYHPLKVRLKEPQRGTRLVHRPGFYAPKPYAEQSAAERRINAAGLIMGGSEGGRFATSVLAAPFPSGSEKAYVPVILEVDGAGLLAETPTGILPLEIYAYAIASDGTVADYFAQAMTFDLAKVGETLAGSGLKFWGSFDLPADDYAVRVLVRNADSGSAALEMSPLTVPAVGVGQSALLPPLFPEPPGRWLLMQEPGSRRDDVPYPFLYDGEAFVPAARPVVPAGGEAALSLVGWNLTGERRAVRGRILDADGRVVGPAAIRLTAAVKADEGGIERISGRLVPGGLAPGEYRLEVTVRDPDGDDAYTSSIPFLVEG